MKTHDASAVEATLPAGPHESESQVERDARMAWWREARFGMFIHWGVYAALGGVYEGRPIAGLGEHIMAQGQIPIAKYKDLAREFNPTQYDAEQWVLLAKRAGMKYIVITAKHIDGFALWPTAVNDWDVESTLHKQDLLQPLAEACRKHGIKLGFYYSQIVDHSNGGTCNNWDPANQRDTDDYIDNLAVPQIRELMTNYGEFPAVLWWDVPVGMNRERASKILDVLKLKPGVIQNNRLYKMAGHMGVVDMENLDAIKGDPFYGDTETPEQYIPATGLGDRDFEVCMTMNDTWGYKSYDHNWKSTRVLLHQLIDIASKGGNYLLNVGPTGEGLIPQASVERLEEIGKWMDVNSESIYGTTASPFAKLAWGRCTRLRQGFGGQADGMETLYFHVFDWPEDGRLVVPGLKNTVTSARLLATGENVTFERTGDDVMVNLPAAAPDANASVIRVEIQGEPDVIQMVALKRTMIASSTWSAPGYEAEKANDDNPGTRWSAAEGTRSGWLEIDLGQEVSVNRAFIHEASYPRTEKFALEYLDGDTWKGLFQGTTIAGEKWVSFTPVTARRFRLNILKASEVPTIEEFTLYGPPAVLVRNSGPATRRTDWFKNAQWGVFTHYLTDESMSAADWNKRVDAFDVPGLARQLEATGCRYFVITLGQNSGHYCSPNATYDKYAGIQPSKCSTRDLVADIHAAIAPKGIRMMLYLPCQTPAADPVAKKGFGLPGTGWNEPLDETFARKWAEVIREWSMRYGRNIAGWWFDGAFPQTRFNDAIGHIYANAVRAGNPEAIVTFNPGLANTVDTWADAEDYTAGEVGAAESVECDGRWLDGKQWHMLSFLGPTWAQKPPRFSDETVIEITRGIVDNEGVVTWDVPIEPSGLIPQSFVDQLAALRVGLAEPKLEMPAAQAIPPWNLAFGKRARLLDVNGTKALQVNSGTHFARNGVDGDPQTKAHAGGEWPWTYHVDLGVVQPIERVVINFDPARYATEYKLKVSVDRKAWTTLAHVRDCDGSRQEHRFSSTQARFVRVQSLKPDGENQVGTQMGVTELEVYGPAN